MKLYYRPGTCSFAAHIILREAGLPFDLDKLDKTTQRTAGGEDFTAVNPKGYVPALRLDDGQVLTEGVVILQYLADQKPESGLAPRAGTLERYRLMEWLNFVATEIHKTFSPLFRPNITPQLREGQLNLLARRLDYVERHLADKPYLMGESFSVADAYLFTVLNWCHNFDIDLGQWPKIKDYVARIAVRPSVRAAKKAESPAK
jgi:glutathione S-transferase